MNIRVLMAAALLSCPTILLADSGISTPEEHVLRGFFDRQSGVVPADKMALKKGSTDDVKAFAKSELEMYEKLANDMVKLYDKFKLVTRANPNNEYRPLEEGKSRGVAALPAGDKYSEVMFVDTLKRESTEATGYGAGGYSLTDLAKLEGAAFDKQYFLLVFYGQQAMLRHCTDELLFDQNNADMVAFCKNAIKQISAQASKADRLYRGEAAQQRGGQGGGQGGMGAGAPGAGAAPAQGAPKAPAK